MTGEKSSVGEDHKVDVEAVVGGNIPESPADGDKPHFKHEETVHGAAERGHTATDA